LEQIRESSKKRKKKGRKRKKEKKKKRKGKQHVEGRKVTRTPSVCRG